MAKDVEIAYEDVVEQWAQKVHHDLVESEVVPFLIVGGHGPNSKLKVLHWGMNPREIAYLLVSALEATGELVKDEEKQQ